MRPLLAWPRPRPVDSGVCLCGHPRHDRPRDTCDRYQPIRVVDPHLPHLAEMAWRHAVLDRRIARDMTVVDIHRRGGIELLIRVAAARVHDAADAEHRDELLDGPGWPAWFIAALTLGEHRQISRRLTERERRILDLASHGCTNAVIATRLGLTEDAVQLHMRAIYMRLDAHDRAHAVRIGFRLGYLTHEDAP